MYQVYCDGQLIHDPRLQGYQLVSPSLSLELNKTGTFTFTLEIHRGSAKRRGCPLSRAAPFQSGRLLPPADLYL